MMPLRNILPVLLVMVVGLLPAAPAVAQTAVCSFDENNYENGSSGEIRANCDTALAEAQAQADARTEEAENACSADAASQRCADAKAAAAQQWKVVADIANQRAYFEQFLAGKDDTDTAGDARFADDAADAAELASDLCVLNLGAESCAEVTATATQARERADYAAGKLNTEQQAIIDELKGDIQDNIDAMPEESRGPFQAALAMVNGLSVQSSVNDINGVFSTIASIDCTGLGPECETTKTYLMGILGLLLDQKAQECAANGSVACIDQIQTLCQTIDENRMNSVGANGFCENASGQNTNFDDLRDEAREVPASQSVDAICTTDPRFNNQLDEDEDGNADVGADGKPKTTAIVKRILTDITTKVTSILDTTVGAMYEGIIGNSQYQRALNAAIILFVIFYGVAFMFGIVQLSAADFVIRLVKVGALFWLLSPGGWEFFYQYVGGFFIGGTNELINYMTGVAAEVFTQPPPDPSGTPGGVVPDTNTVLHSDSPLMVLEDSLLKIFSIKTGIALMALIGSVVSDPFGLVHAFFLIIGIFFYTRAFLMAVWVFLMSIIVKALLFALAPIFLVFLLFEKTRYLFEGWLSQLISYSLQPIFLFMFLGFYSTLMAAGINQVLDVKICWIPMQVGDVEAAFWRFVGDDDVNGAVQDLMNTTPELNPDLVAEEYPIDIVSILLFAFISYIAWGASSVCVQLAEDLASGASLENMKSSLHIYFGGMWNKGKSMVTEQLTKFLPK